MSGRQSQTLAGVDAVRIGQVVETHQALDRRPVRSGDLAQGLPGHARR